MLEKDIETYLRNEVKKIGGIAYKFESPGNLGVPDRLVLLPNGLQFFVELKAPGKKLRATQVAQHKRLENLGQVVFTLDSKAQVHLFIDMAKGLITNGVCATQLPKTLH